ncbi:MAG TPA: hypothetical protein PKA33_17825 [Amaricoccus sp.]|uniref:relaxase/mobilization nuclease domain-containing protein n=1 Tax=Amaricoccus sp. TaxID=1872485 RepID=UPI002C9C3D74|nr:relaxase/mobilization nuclease domain-containing protein [Amaricoccus sp.]HMQ92844.1 hypothetical protein [Amaricoccus sp.]HMR37052.1 hypothetical protein [Paracoccus sp. (in: a-proteobacteria)]HMR54164.1 hypothetical protein [Amaricoccus sp.]HMU01207.1 hypothetical protein [Amaricoccus sp.]
MILKGSQRGNGADLAIHLMNSFDNERVEIAEVYGTVAGDLYGAFAEFEAVAAGTKAKQYLYSLSINPPSALTREQYFACVQAIENRLGLTDQPRAVVFHVKRDAGGEAREHCHVVWSRIDSAQMKAIHMGHDHSRLMDLACELAHKYGLALSPGLQAWEARQKRDLGKLEPTFAERAQQKNTGITPEQRRAEITAAYERSDSVAAFRAALAQKGYVLAKGDRRGLVIVDRHGAVHSLSRYIKGHTAKAIRERLAFNHDALPTVEQAKEHVRDRERKLAEKQQQAQAADAAGEKAAQAKQQRREELRRRAGAGLARRHEQRRTDLRGKEQQLLVRQQAERMALHAAQKAESGGILFRVRTAVAELVGRTPALRSVLGPLQKMTKLDPRERHDLERGALERRHERERKDFDREKRMLARLETRERQALEKALRQREKQAEKIQGQARQAFDEAAHDQVVRTATGIEEGELQVQFNDAAEFVEGAGKDGGDDDDRAPSWKQRGEKEGVRRRPRRGQGVRRPRD